MYNIIYIVQITINENKLEYIIMCVHLTREKLSSHQIIK